MSANIKTLLAFTLIEMCADKNIKKITVTRLIEISGVSRQVFYNNFKDLQDLILWTYIHKVQMPVTERVWSPKALGLTEYTEGMVDILKRCQQYLPFMQFAYRDTSQNCLRVAGAEWVIEAEKESVKHEFGIEEISEESDYCIRALTKGFFDYVGDWIMKGAKDPSPEILATYIVGLRFRSYRDLFPGVSLEED